MKISYNWLKEYLLLDLAAQDLAEPLLALGFEIASLEIRQAQFSGVVAAKILSVDKHPNADRLSLCSVDNGRERLSIVCGAKNVKPGLVVALATIGARLPGERVLAKTTIRGVESQGMLCSSSELGLGADHDGILVLNPGMEIGADLKSVLTKPDAILDVEITPNRPDCLSHLGLARELAAYLKLNLKDPVKPGFVEGGACIPIENERKEACPLYVGRVLANLEIRPSPGWLSAKLETVGLRSINNLVDITNYLLMDMGQPMHVFDLDKLEGGRIVVRWANSGEKIAALDGNAYELSPQCLVIADAKKPAAIAGIMGGVESSVTEKTKRAFLESAYFSPIVVRKASQMLRLRSDSSYRFERGTDPAAPSLASRRAAALAIELCGKTAQVSAQSQIGAEAKQPDPIIVSTQRINEILGSQFADGEIVPALERISVGLEKQGGQLKFSPPTYRHDLSTAWDLAEETGRMLGYGKISAKMSHGPLTPSRISPSQNLAQQCRQRLMALGLGEAYNNDFISAKLLEHSRLKIEGPWMRLANPLSAEAAILRPTLLIGLLQNLATNLNRGASAVRLFELGKIYYQQSSGAKEKAFVSGLMVGPVAEPFWKSERNFESGFYDIKGVAEELLSGVSGLSFMPFKPGEGQSLFSEPLFHPTMSLKISSNKGILGILGLLHPQAAQRWKLQEGTVCFFELDLDAMLALDVPRHGFKPYSPFPGSWRDLSLVVGDDIAYAQVEKTALQAGGENLKEVRLADVFTGAALGPGKSSLTVRLNFGRDDRTLTDVEINQDAQRIIAAMETKLGAKLRQ